VPAIAGPNAPPPLLAHLDYGNGVAETSDMRRTSCISGLVAVAGVLLLAGPLTLPNIPESLKLAVIGDNGTGDRAQEEVAAQMVKFHQEFAYDLVLMVGDNFYGSQKPSDLEQKFARPFRPLLDAGVTFHAALGNHDTLGTIDYAPINMQGQRYYSYVRKNVRFFVLDTNVLDAPQLKWAETALQQSAEPWKVAYFHHPLYSNAGRHGSNVDVRVLLEPLLIKYGVQVVFSGHDHVYERLKPQKGIHYFVTGSGGKLRKGDLRRSETTAVGFDRDQAFMLVEIGAGDLHFQTVSRTGATVDSGRIRRPTARIGS
jgi:predicted MPP superfamily phosphohydrolase